MSAVARMWPWIPKAHPPTIRYSTPESFKSWRKSLNPSRSCFLAVELDAQALDGGQTFSGGEGEAVAVIVGHLAREGAVFDGENAPGGRWWGVEVGWVGGRAGGILVAVEWFRR